MQLRAEQVARTRGRIIEAATEVLARRGARGMTMAEVARAADVSPATVTNHFATPDLLLEAVVAHVMAEIDVPDPLIFRGARSLTERLRALTASMFAFYERASSWFEVLGGELVEVPVLAEAEARFWQSMQRLYAEALEGAEDALLARTTAGLVHPATFGALRAAGLSVDEATGVVSDSVVRLARGGRA
jgi:AcrR family transcriptional regulator